MSSIIEKDGIIPKQRLFTVICLIMILEYETLDLEELIKVTGLSLDDILQATKNLVSLKLIKVYPTFKGVPKFNIINKNEAEKFIKMAGA